MPTTGVRGTASLAARKYDVADVISLLDVERYPLLAILTNAGKDPVTKQGKAIKKQETTDPEFKWFEDQFQKKQVTGTTSGTFTKGGGGSITVTGNAALFQEGDVVLLEVYGGVHVVTGITAPDTITVGKDLGGSSGDLKNTATTVTIIGNANEEGAGLRDIKGTTSTEMTGYCQIFRTPFGITETAKETKTFIRENDLDYQRRKKAIEHMIDIERAFWFSKLYKETGVSHPKRYTAGILSRISTYATSNVDTESEFETWLESAFAHGNSEKYLFASPAVVSMINGWAKGKLEITQGERNYGLTILKYLSPHGTVNIIKHDLLIGPVYGNYAVMLDMECLTYRYLSNRDTKLLTNRQNPGEDAIVEEYLTECGLQMEQESRHAIMSIGAL